METPERRIAPRGDRRILYVSDPSSIAMNLFPDPASPDDLRRWVDMLADSGVDTFNQEVYSQGWTAYWRSEQFEYDRRMQHRRFIPMMEAGTQPLEVLVEQSHQRGLTFIAGFRMNDNHSYQAVQQGVGLAGFIDAHPEWVLREFPEGDLYQMSVPLDFTFEGPRDYVYRVMEEVVARFDVDGLEMCFRDHAYFPVHQGRERAHLMTDLVRRVRALLDEKGPLKGKRLLLGARVFSTLDECHHLGLDVPAWIAEGLIDYLSPQDVMFSDFNAPYAEFAALTRASNCMLYPALLPWTSVRARARLDQIPLSPANGRALAQTFYGAGADGLSIYNHFCAMWHPPFYPQSLRLFHELRDPSRVAAGSRHYIFDPTWVGFTGFGGVDRCSTGAVKAHRIVLDRDTPHATGEYRFNLYEDLAQSQGATLLFRGFNLTAHDQLEVRLNGQTIPDGVIGRTAARGTPADQWFRELPIDQIADFRLPIADCPESGIRNPKSEIRNPVRRCLPEQGRIDFRPDPEPAFSTRWFDLTAPLAVYGENRLSVTLTRSDPQASGPMVIDELEGWVFPA